ncbi:DUF420 domain-containing protein [bacterium]|nr:DUF420 domain-containing protein [bacterium]
MDLVDVLPHVNATLNALATLLLVVGFVFIKQGKVAAHKWTMLSCFGVSVVFLVCYLVYHALMQGHSKTFPSYPPNWIRYGYYAMLLSHVVLAAAVPVLAVITIYLGLKDRREAHRKIAVWTFPIWLYVSVTGVLVYLFLYQFFPAETAA